MTAPAGYRWLAIEGSGYAEIESGHVVLFEQPAEFVKLVKDFIDRP